MRGRILAVAEASAAGVVAGDDGRRYAYGLSDQRSAALRAGDMVDFRIESESDPSRDVNHPGGAARDLYLIAGVAPLFLTDPGVVPAPAGSTPGHTKPDWTAFYLNPNGRVALGDYWLYGVLVLFAVNLFVGWIPVFGQIASLVAAWAGIALAIKRCHDVDRSGWWSWVPFIPLLTGLTAIPLSLSNAQDAAIAVGTVCTVALLGTAAWVFFAILIRRGDMGANRFGPPPIRMKP